MTDETKQKLYDVMTDIINTMNDGERATSTRVTAKINGYVVSMNINVQPEIFYDYDPGADVN